ncbi:MAG: hypothetical protein FJX71_05700 [Alphaproteobacteria bacterium]|nr:hypothetical protein [Alphaproteobacteria bacterium]
MKYIYLVILSLLCFASNSIFSADHPSSFSPEKHRPGNVYVETNIESYPQPTTFADCVQLSTSLINSEIKFWEQTQIDMLDKFPKLKVIVSLLKQNLMNLELRMRILEKPEDHNMYSTYCSYGNIVKKLKIFKPVFEQDEDHTSKQPDKEHQLIQKVIIDLQNMKRKEGNGILLLRGLIQAPAMGRSAYEIRQSQKNKLHQPLKEDDFALSLCDVEYVTDIFVPLLINLFKRTETATQQNLGKASETKNTSTIALQPLKPAEKSETRPARKGEELPEITKKQEKPCEETLVTFEAPSAKSEHISTASTIVFKDVERSEDIHAPKAAGEKATLNFDSLLTASTIPTTGESSAVALSPEELDVTPWKQYEDKKKLEGRTKQNTALEPVYVPPIFMLGEENSRTAKRLLGLGDRNSHLENLPMIDYIHLIQELGGSIINFHKSVHFVARGLKDKRWYSVTMHRLHGDDPTDIPRNTRFWSIAKQLLLDIGLTEANLYR